MHPATPGPRKRRLAVLIALAALCAVTMVSLTQCINVADKVTGTSARGEADYRGGGGTSRCFSRCRDRYEKALEKEEERHERNIEKCRRSGGDDRGDGRGDDRRNNRECIEAERERHQAAVAEIKEERRQCQAECHHQGGGSGR